jgi:hypothetical protein
MVEWKKQVQIRAQGSFSPKLWGARDRGAPFSRGSGLMTPFVIEIYSLADDAEQSRPHRSIFTALRIRL